MKFILTSNTTDKAKLKIELEAFGRMLWLKSFFRNDEKEFNPDKFKPKSTFNLRNRYAAIEIYLRNLEEKLMSIKIRKDKYKNLTREERGALFDLKNDKTIVIKGADKGSTVVVWDMDDNIQKTEKKSGR